MARRSSPEVNAGSMADIAFLLLIFFLVTTTIETDSGINKRLPPIDDSEQQEDVKLKQKNILTVAVNAKDELLIEDKKKPLDSLKTIAIAFLDNGGGINEKVEDSGKDWLKYDPVADKWVNNIIPNTKNKSYLECSYCQGKGDPKSSDNPDKAIISLTNQRETSYAMYISIQNEIMAAYNEVRNRRSLDIFGQSFQEMKKNWKDVNHPDFKSPSLKKKIEQIQKEYPQKFTESQEK
tara:strand:+ start:100 stop:807 length:708 start_codon:yes stop_codon:yes gene_type:complete